jgi:hypothetical protein
MDLFSVVSLEEQNVGKLAQLDGFNASKQEHNLSRSLPSKTGMDSLSNFNGGIIGDSDTRFCGNRFGVSIVEEEI